MTDIKVTINDAQPVNVTLYGVNSAINLEDLSNVNITNVIDGQVLTYNTTLGKWINSEDSLIQLEADEDILAGQPLYLKQNGKVALANGSSISNAKVIGLASITAKDNFTVNILNEGMLSLDDWTDITGSNDLTVGLEYYLNTSGVGLLTVTAPTAIGEYVKKVGLALSSRVMLINISILVTL
jgi:hypothetical protein